MATNREQIIECLQTATGPLDDDEIARRTGISPRQTVNHICRQLASEGLIRRSAGPDQKLTNALTDNRDSSAVSVESNPAASSSPAAGSSLEQRDAEPLILAALSRELGVRLAPKKMTHPNGARVELDGADEALTVLVECWAHQGPAKVAQRSKLVKDAVKLAWIAKSLPSPPRLVLCVTDAAAVRHLAGQSWEGYAISDLGVEIVVVELPPDIRRRITEAQVRQFR